MALVKGTVTVNADGTHSSTGLLGRMFEAQLVASGIEASINGMPDVIPRPGDPPIDNDARRTSALIDAKTRLAEGLEPIAFAIVDEITQNAVVAVTVGTGDAGLQRTPDPNDPNTDTQGPSADKTLFGTIT